MIELKNISFRYENSGLYSIKNINLKIYKGEVILLCGKSGCGKTTITRLINGLIPNLYQGELNGEIIIDGKVISKESIQEISKKVSSVFQNPKSQFFNQFGIDELVFKSENYGVEENIIIKRIKDTVDKFHIGKLLNQDMFTMSGGEKQILACASVSVFDSNIIVLDEPSSNLDIGTISKLSQILMYWKNQGKTIIITEHRLQYLNEVVNRVFYVDEGQIKKEYNIEKFKEIKNHHREKMGLRSMGTVKFEPKNFNDSKNIEIRDFIVEIGEKKILNIPKYKFPKNSIIGIIGKNGAGKTTFVKNLCGLLREGKGNLIIDDHLMDKKERSNEIYFVMQDVNHQLFTESVLEEINIDLKDKYLSLKLIKDLGLEGLEDRHPMSLSGGEKQRVVIGTAIASKKNIIILDEPTSGLDYRGMMQVSCLIKKLSEKGKTIIIVTHDPELLNEVCNYIIHIEDGEIDWSGVNNENINKKLMEFFKFQT